MHLRHLILRIVPIVYSVDIKHLLYVPFNHLNRGVTSSRRLHHQSPDFKSGGYQLCCERLLCTSGMGGKTRTCEPPDPKSGVLPTELHPYDGTLTKRPRTLFNFQGTIVLYHTFVGVSTIFYVCVNHFSSFLSPTIV
jgi:hypothetical protein